MKKINDIHRRILFRVVEGTMNKTTIAKEVGWHPGSLSRFIRSPAAQEELSRLRQEAERELAQRLPNLVRQALDVVESALSLKHRPAERLRAALFVLTLADKAMSTKPEPEPEPEPDSVILDITPVEPPTDPHH